MNKAIAGILVVLVIIGAGIAFAAYHHPSLDGMMMQGEGMMASGTPESGAMMGDATSSDMMGTTTQGMMHGDASSSMMMH